MMAKAYGALTWIRRVGSVVVFCAACKPQEAPLVQPPPTAAAVSVARPNERALASAPMPKPETDASGLASGAVAAPPPRAPLAASEPSIARATAGSDSATKYAILVSVDGLAPRFLEELLRQGKAPTFAALQKLGAWTHDARTDKTFTITLPNHTSMVTGLPVSPSPGFAAHRAHRYTENVDPLPDASLHPLRDQAHTYTPSMFDVAHDHGLSTAMFANKSKFSIYSQSYNDAGGPDAVGPDNGRKKIDTVQITHDVDALVGAFIAQLESAPPNLTFLHFGSPDAMGHGVGWGSPQYFAAVQHVDTLLGHILNTIQRGKLTDKTALVITADHGGVGVHHADITDIRNFQIPFYVMAPGVTAGDAYDVFKARFAPGPINPEYNAPQQPLRNGDSGNVALFLLGLPQIPDSIIQSAGLRLN